MSIKDFKNCDVRYTYDKDNKIYSVKVLFNGRPLIMTMRVGPQLMDVTVMDADGRVIEYLGQEKKQLQYRANKELLEKFSSGS